ncbi:hypothetical protein ABZ341_16995 [Streptomyces sp. NPDC006173]|uniref:hypothetical protein n=1 Tax=Streptomyces sp. NPDC006173 TaxID=3155349 RepID=UPI0033F19D34
MIHSPIHTVDNAPEPSNLTVAVNVVRLLLAEHEHVDHRDLFAVNRAHGALAEALRILLRAAGVEGTDEERTVSVPPPNGGQRCPAAFTDDAAPCDGPPVVLILDPNNRGAEGCEHHGTRLLAVIKDGRAVALPEAPEGTASRVFRAAASLRYFASHKHGEQPQTNGTDRGCGAPATVRIEGYSHARGSVYGSLDLAVYACQEHAHEARTGWLGGRQPHTGPSFGNACGHVFDYSKPGGGE